MACVPDQADSWGRNFDLQGRASQEGDDVRLCACHASEEAHSRDIPLHPFLCPRGAVHLVTFICHHLSQPRTHQILLLMPAVIIVSSFL